MTTRRSTTRSPAGASTSTTRDRLLTAGLRLFADRGFDAVSVGEIERAVGLVPRRGGLYRHFASKEDLLHAAVDRHLGSVTAGREQFNRPAASDVRTDAVLLAWWILDELDRQHDITRVLERDGHRLPHLRDTFRRDVSEVAYASMADILRAWLTDCIGADLPADELDAVATHLLGALINLRRSTWTLGQPPASLDDHRATHAWAELCTRIVGEPPQPPAQDQCAR
ncbi:MAG: TetR/AcrR family transcriptional regulator [Nocardioidaceae bacterium]